MTPRQQLALTLTVAAEQLEGWRPQPRHLSDLAAVLGGTATFGQYLGSYLAEERDTSASTPRPRMFARSRPYLIRGSTVLRNNFGTTDHAVLQRLEFVATAGRMALLLAHPEKAPTDPLAVHQELFADVYPWAGLPRIVEISKGGSHFAPVDTLDTIIAQVQHDAATLTATSTDTPRLSYGLARLYARYNSAHPFREGNGRTGVTLMQLICAHHGHHLDIGRVERADWVRASRESMPFRRGGEPDHRPFLPLLLGIIKAHR